MRGRTHRTLSGLSLRCAAARGIWCCQHISNERRRQSRRLDGRMCVNIPVERLTVARLVSARLTRTKDIDQVDNRNFSLITKTGEDLVEFGASRKRLLFGKETTGTAERREPLRRCEGGLAICLTGKWNPVEYRQADSAPGKSVGKPGKTHFKLSQSPSGIN